MTTVVIDFETRSAVDLKIRGLGPYASHQTTEIMCLSAAQDDQTPVIWIPDKFLCLSMTFTIADKPTKSSLVVYPGQGMSKNGVLYEIVSKDFIVDMILSADIIVAQNSMFEYKIWEHKMGTHLLPLERLHDTKAQLAYHSLPLNLEAAGNALGLRIQKDMAGNAAMKKLCKPKKPTKKEKEKFPNWENKIFWNENPKDLISLFNYCCRDVETERIIYNTLSKLPDKERRIWLLDQQINLFGVPIDTKTVSSIIKTTKRHELTLLNEFQEATNKEVSGPRSYVAFKNWVNEQTGFNYKSVDKTATTELLSKDIPDNVRNALEIKEQLSKSSVAKFSAMIDRMDEDHRVRYWAVYGGASTLRWSANGLQFHNNPRDSFKPKEHGLVSKLFLQGDLDSLTVFHNSPFMAASKCVRGVIKAPPGKEFICADFSSIEGRGLAYLAGEEAVLDAYRKGTDLYKLAASDDIFGIPYDEINDKQRQVGKVSELALGYAGGIGAYASMAKGYSIDLETLPPLILPTASSHEIEREWGARHLASLYLKENPGTMSLEAAMACDVIKQRWRTGRPYTTAFWKKTEEAAKQAVENPGQVFSVGKIKYGCSNGFLKCLLPSGRVINYFKPRLSEEDNSLSYYGMKIVGGKTTRQWTLIPTYSGKLVENVVQAFCRDILAEAVLSLNAAGYRLVLHVHDEILAEIDKGSGDLEHFTRIMTQIPVWAKGMPISASGWIGENFRKG